MQIVVFLSIVSYVRLEIDTKSVTNCQTSMTFGIDMVFFAPAFGRQHRLSLHFPILMHKVTPAPSSGKIGRVKTKKERRVRWLNRLISVLITLQKRNILLVPKGLPTPFKERSPECILESSSYSRNAD